MAGRNLLFVMLGVLSLVGCSPADKGSALPGPTPTAEKQRSPQVRVELVQGPALPMARLLSKSVADGLVDQGVTATVGGDSAAAYVLSGRAEANWTDAGAPFVMLIYWTLVDASGQRIGAYTQGVRGARWKWEYGDPGIIRAVGSGAATPVSSMIAGDAKTSLPFLLVGAGILIRPVTGAPGGANGILTEAIKAALTRADVLITEDSRQASVTLDGTVAVVPVGDGREKVTIVWRISTLDGFDIGSALQENTVAAAQLADSWVTEAPKIADAALKGIKRILKAGNSRSGLLSRGNEAGPATPSNIRQFPGDAPPSPD